MCMTGQSAQAIITICLTPKVKNKKKIRKSPENRIPRFFPSLGPTTVPHSLPYLLNEKKKRGKKKKKKKKEAGLNNNYNCYYKFD